jgi:hypothetical protein
VLECVCGQFLRGETDDELFAWVHEHVDRHHSELGFGKERLRTIVVNAAYWPEEDAPAAVGSNFRRMRCRPLGKVKVREQR